jgi:photosystem II stability/assembly factor-like uncharacterized protein
MRVLPLYLLVAAGAIAVAQSPSPAPASAVEVWQMQDSGTTAGLRGIDSVDGTVAWASGTGGTVLRTLDGGQHWQKCAIPDGGKDGATLDFRGIQAWDANTAIVMASGPGDKSRLYKTTDGCRTWKLVFRNLDKDGFWDALKFDGPKKGMILGDPVHGAFAVFITLDGGASWKSQKPPGSKPDPSEQAIFAASNSSLLVWTDLAHRIFVTGGKGGAHLFECHGELNVGGRPERVDCLQHPILLPLAQGGESTGAFSMDWSAAHCNNEALCSTSMVAVGGDYTKPNESAGTSAYSLTGGDEWTASTTPPHGYRSTVQWSESLKLWVTAGTNGSDMSRDDGRTWQPLDKGNWNALSLPFIVGPNGRIARLNPAALSAGK